MILQYIAVGLGGALGSIIRIYLSKTLALTIFGIPFQLLAVNVLGSFIMGILTQLASLYWLESENIKYFLISGLLGGFTTFSGFALDFGLLIEQEKYMPAIFYVMLSVGLSLSCFFLGLKITKLFTI
jgi:CrcB protein